MKTIVICNFPRFSSEIWLPSLWVQAKTYYELHGEHKDQWQWFPCYLDCYSSDYLVEIQKQLYQAKPDIFAISLYVWNYRLAHEVAEWVKVTFPNCLIISGGPHQYLKHDANWFKKHWYLDASHPGDCYGELMFKELLDNYDNGKVDWPSITDIRYPTGKSKILSIGKKSMPRAERKNYQYDWSAFTAQLDELKKFQAYQKTNFPDSILLGILETTRGCPYGCTYCDWGGGISTTVIQKSLSAVKMDIDALCEFDIKYLYLADANFGIFGDRDVEIIQYLVDEKNKKSATFKVGYGGFAKTENRLNYIKEILEIDINNNLSNNKEIKISLQSLDQEVLDNIDRKNIDLEKQLEVFKPIAEKTRLPLYVEIIMGLPGMTLDKFSNELDIFGKHQLSIQWFEWILLPEAPAYSADYRNKWGIKTTIKSNGWSYPDTHANHEIVVGTNSYSQTDYLEMLLSSSLYNLFIQGGYYKHTVEYILKKYNIGHGKLINTIYRNFFLEHNGCKVEKDKVFFQWNNIITNTNQDCTFIIGNEKIYGGYYFIALIFSSPKFEQLLVEWINEEYNIPLNIQHQDLNVYYNKNNAGKKVWNLIYLTDFTSTPDIQSIIKKYRLFSDTGKIMTGCKKLLGIFKINK